MNTIIETCSKYYFKTPRYNSPSLQLGRYPETKFGAAAPLQGPANGPPKNEGSPAYYRVVCYLSEKVRLIVCKDGIQWIIQRRKGPKYEGFWFARTKNGLLRGLYRLDADEPISAKTWEIVNALPEIQNLDNLGEFTR